MLALGMFGGPGSTAEFRLTNTVGLNNARMARSQAYRMIPRGATQLTDLGGEDPENYGDGAGDGFTDNFLTPAAVSMEVCQLVAYKSEANGGPARGAETLENANFTLMKLSSPYMEVSDICSGFTPVALKGGDSTKSSYQLPILALPEEGMEEYDRIGIVLRSFSYYFDPADLPENSYRYVDLILNHPQTPVVQNMMVKRGDVAVKLFSMNSNPLYATTPAMFFPDLYLNPGEMSSFGFSVQLIDIVTGGFLYDNGDANVGFNGINAFEIPGTGFNSEMQKLKFKGPATLEAQDEKTPYVLVVDFTPGTSGENGSSAKLGFDVSVDNVLFWDSNDGNGVYSPQRNVADRTNAVSGTDNLTNAARQNVIFHLPTMLGNSE
ncbi:hypothetical protein EHQ12_04930 [Leptospira gomenensis]|uniref:Uncharacterized protein n=1 Tax=Leptospira gomenensis TaxID=2484974 RepID=A0A5F1YGA3_9LEPT|nr:hypothetical protein EHQ17_00275 [Leptospira gomenensis]TGK42550.1 hypothetical protein EHQ12_04930 [Leptospira gomenensis]TGK48968.1 hypothetical protein EHQ07_05025 [Leptospira gomenensis]TGK54678.1 hypothetical protein EHQ13_18995 [Leptospira gomenensis]